MNMDKVQAGEAHRDLIVDSLIRTHNEELAKLPPEEDKPLSPRDEKILHLLRASNVGPLIRKVLVEVSDNLTRAEIEAAHCNDQREITEEPVGSSVPRFLFLGEEVGNVYTLLVALSDCVYLTLANYPGSVASTSLCTINNSDYLPKCYVVRDVEALRKKLMALSIDLLEETYHLVAKYKQRSRTEPMIVFDPGGSDSVIARTVREMGYTDVRDVAAEEYDKLMAEQKNPRVGTDAASAIGALITPLKKKQGYFDNFSGLGD